MRDYGPTDKGQQLAYDSGVEDLALRLIASDKDFPPIISYVLEDEYRRDWSPASDDLPQAISHARSLLKTNDELATFERGLTVQPEEGTWQHKTGEDTDGLFPAPAYSPFEAASEEDGLVLSGAAGLSLANYRSKCPLLARSRFEEFGFRSYPEACAFVGAQVVGKLINYNRFRYQDAHPAFSYAKDGVVHTISVSGSFDGDYRMTESRRMQADILSPIHTATEFGPKPALGVAAYHSIEPEIVATLVEAEFLRAGADAAKVLVDEFVTVILEAANGGDRIPYRSGPFGDYGAGNSPMVMTNLSLLLSRPEFKPLACVPYLHSSPYLPQSSTLFEMLPTPEGMKFQNRNADSQDEVAGISIPREYYPLFLRSLIGQAAAGLGRTSPMQLVQVVGSAQRILELGSSAGTRFIDELN